MEVDNTQAEVESQLIAMFRSMGTTDKEQLLTELRTIIGSGVDEKTCLFFLDLGHWNLHEAIGAYYDHYLQQQPPIAGSLDGMGGGEVPTVMGPMTAEEAASREGPVSPLRLLSYRTLSPDDQRELSTVLPHSEVIIRLYIENTSAERLPAGCCLKLHSSWLPGDHSAAEETRLMLPDLITGQVAEMMARVVSPADSGQHELSFHPELLTGEPLGEDLRVPLQVEGQALDLEDQFMREVRTRPAEDISDSSSQTAASDLFHP